MDSLDGAERKVLHAVNTLPSDLSGYVSDDSIAEETRVSIDDARNLIECLDKKRMLDVAKIDGGYCCLITAEGRLALGKYGAASNRRANKPAGSLSNTQAATQKRPANSVKSKPVELKINKPYDSFSQEDQERVLAAVVNLLRLSEPIPLLLKSRGCVRLVIAIPGDRTEELLAAIRDGRLANLDVVGAQLLGSEEVGDTTPNSQQAIVRTSTKSKNPSPKKRSASKDYKKSGVGFPKGVSTSGKPKPALKKIFAQSGGGGGVATSTKVGVKTGSSAIKSKQAAARQQSQAQRASALLKHVSEPTRLVVILTLAQGEKHVGELCAQLSQSQPAVSHHLALLRHGGIIAPRRQGKDNFYGLTEIGQQLAKVVTSLIEK